MSVLVVAKYRALFSDNRQGGSGKVYEDSVEFLVDEKFEIGNLKTHVENHIRSKTGKVAEISGFEGDTDFQLISVEVKYV